MIMSLLIAIGTVALVLSPGLIPAIVITAVHAVQRLAERSGAASYRRRAAPRLVGVPAA